MIDDPEDIDDEEDEGPSEVDVTADDDQEIIVPGGAAGLNEVIPEPEQKFTPKELRFMDEYCSDENVKRSAMAAGYSENVAKTKAYSWVIKGNPEKPHVAAEIQRRKRMAAQKWGGVTGKRIVKEFARIGLANIADFGKHNDKGEFEIDLTDVPREKMAAIAEYTCDSITQGNKTLKRVRIKFHPKMQALDSLAKYLDLYGEAQPAPFLIDNRVINQQFNALGGQFASPAKTITADDAESTYLSLIGQEPVVQGDDDETPASVEPAE